MNQSIKSVIITVITIGVIVAVGYGVNAIYQNVQIENQASEFRASFIDGCTSEGEKESLCACIYDDMKNEVGTKGIYDIAMEYEETGEMPNQTIVSAYKCYIK